MVFVVGPPRSGTTLLGYLLGGGEGVLSVSEPFLARRIYPHWRLRWFFSRIARKAHLRSVPLPKHTDEKDFLAFLNRLAEHNGLPHLVIKETFRHDNTWANLDLLDRLAAGTDPLVAITRHPYDIAVSTLRFCRWWRGIAGRVLRLWVHDLPLFETPEELMRSLSDNWTAFTKWARKNRLFLLRYEHLVTDPANSLRQVCEHSHLPFREEMAMFPYPRTTFGGLGAPEVLQSRPKPISARSVGRKELLPPPLREIIRERCEAAAKELNYEL